MTARAPSNAEVPAVPRASADLTARTYDSVVRDRERNVRDSEGEKWPHLRVSSGPTWRSGRP